MSSDQLEEVLPAEAGCFDDLVEGSSGEVAAVHRNHDAVTVVGMAEDVVAALGAVELPAAALQRSDCLSRRDAREAGRHALTVTRSISIGPGIGSPCASSDSR